MAEHSWNVQRILIAIFPIAPRHMLLHAMVHDIGEVATGDLPFPVKLKNPDLKKTMDSAERDAHLRMCIPWGIPAPILLTDQEKLIFKCADYIEMWEWALDELGFGNTLAKPVLHRCMDAVQQLIDKLPHDVRSNVKSYMQRRVNTYVTYATSK